MHAGTDRQWRRDGPAPHNELSVSRVLHDAENESFFGDLAKLNHQPPSERGFGSVPRVEPLHVSSLMKLGAGRGKRVSFAG